MKKYVVFMVFLILGANLMAGPFTEKDIPEDVKKEIVQNFNRSSSESRHKDISDAKDAYIRLQNKAYNSGIPKKDLETIIVRLHQMYGTNFQKQSAEFDNEAAQYKDMVRRIEEKVQQNRENKVAEDKQAKIDMEALRQKNILSREITDLILKKANEKYPNHPLAQKYFLEGAIELQKLKK